MSKGLDALLNPGSVAVVGASANESKIGNVVLRSLSKGGFEIYPVNLREKEILGLKCYESVSSIPGKVDLALIVLPAESALEAASECVEKGVGVVIVTSSGFSESGPSGKSLQDRLSSVFEGSGTRLLGPNTMGVLVPSRNLDTLLIPSEKSPRPPPGSVAMVSQSGAVAIAFLEKAAAFGMGVSSCVCIGNKADIEECELLDLFAEDPGTDCICMYLESFSDGRRFLDAARRASARKPVVVLKSGRTGAGARAASSHTGAVAASSDALVDGALRQAGVIRAYDEEELVDLARALAYLGHAKGDRVCVVASAGGFGVIAADYIESSDHGFGLRMAELSEKTQAELAAVMPAFSSVRNPVDLTAEVTDEMYDAVLSVLQTDPGVDCILMSLELQPPNVTRGLVDVASRRRATGSTPIVVSAFGGSESQSTLAGLEINKVPSYPTIHRAARAVATLVERGAYLRRQK
ncbi:MAG: acetate--CoA ligase family protein [Thermoplasmata archaeon]